MTVMPGLRYSHTQVQNTAFLSWGQHTTLGECVASEAAKPHGTLLHETQVGFSEFLCIETLLLSVRLISSIIQESLILLWSWNTRCFSFSAVNRWIEGVSWCFQEKTPQCLSTLNDQRFWRESKWSVIVFEADDQLRQQFIKPRIVFELLFVVSADWSFRNKK